MYTKYTATVGQSQVASQNQDSPQRHRVDYAQDVHGVDEVDVMDWVDDLHEVHHFLCMDIQQRAPRAPRSPGSLLSAAYDLSKELQRSPQCSPRSPLSTTYELVTWSLVSRLWSLVTGL